MAVSISRRLNLTLPVDTDAGEVYVHSSPISREVFERYYDVIGRTFAKIYRGGYGGATAGPRFAALILRTVAEETGEWDTAGGVRDGLLSEIRRLSMVVVPGERGWSTVPLEEAVHLGKMSEDDVEEAVGILVFFTVASWVHPKRTRNRHLEAANGLWGGQLTSSNPTEFAASLPILIGIANSGEKREKVA